MGKIKITTRRKLFKCFALLLLWKDGAVVRALTSYQCGPDSNPGVDAICGFCFFFNYMGVEFVLYVGWVCFNLVNFNLWVEFVLIWFFSGYSGLPLSSKTNISKFWFDQESWRQRTTLWMCYLQCTCTIII